MGRLLWPVALTVTFFVGWVVGGVARTGPPALPDAGHERETTARLQQQVSTLQARLRAREDLVASRKSGETAHPGGAPGVTEERPLPFMRQLATSQAEPSYRLQAIRYLTAQGDQQALAALHVLMQSPNEQPSIRDAAAQAYTAISGK